MFLIMILLSSLITVMSSDMTTAGFVFRKEKTSPRILYSYNSLTHLFFSRTCYVFDLFNNNNQAVPAVPCEFSCLAEEYPEPYCPNLTTTSSSWHETQRKVMISPALTAVLHEFDCVTFSYCIPEQSDAQVSASAENHVSDDEDKNLQALMGINIAILIVLCLIFIAICALLVMVIKQHQIQRKISPHQLH